MHLIPIITLLLSSLCSWFPSTHISKPTSTLNIHRSLAIFLHTSAIPLVNFSLLALCNLLESYLNFEFRVINVFLPFLQMNELLNFFKFWWPTEKKSHVWSPKYPLLRSYLQATAAQSDRDLKQTDAAAAKRRRSHLNLRSLMSKVDWIHLAFGSF